jgi:hypothetical protein
MVELDSAISNLIGLDFKKINHIVKAENIGVGKFPVPEILEKFKDGKFLDFKLAMKFERFGKNFYAWPTYSCSRCITALNEFGRDIKKHPIKNIKFIKKAFVGNKKIHFVIGRADDLSLSIEKGDTIISIGNCSKNFSQKCGINCLDKCPPTVKETREWIENSL